MEIKIKLKPWIVPVYVNAETSPGLRQDGMKELPNWHIRELEPEVLSAMCDQFRKDVFESAGKIDPRL